MQARNAHKLRRTIGRGILYAVLISSSLVMAFPLLFGLAGSISTIEDYVRTPWFPIPYSPTLQNYEIILSGGSEVLLWVRNTLIRAIWYILVPGAVGILGGYALSRLKFRGRDSTFILLLSSMVMPGIVYLVPTFVMMARMPFAGGNDMFGQGGSGFVNQWPALLITGLVNVYFIFMFRQTFMTIPPDFEEAARVDGAGTLRCLWSVYMPMLKPVLTVLVIVQFVAIWNDYTWPLFVSTGNPKIWTLSLGFQYLALAGAQRKGLPGSITDYTFVFALATFAILPLIVLYMFMQRFFVEGVQGFAVKG